jgi:hypothetical protein
MTMNRRSMMVFGLSVALLVPPPAFAGNAPSGDWPTRWQVNGNGETGVLEFSIGENGALSGRLLNRPVAGYVSGRHLILRRSFDERTEVWDGWLGQPREAADIEDAASSQTIVAGTISVSEAGQTQVYPWFGTSQSLSSGSASSSPAAAVLAVTPPAAFDSPAAGTPDAGPLSGFWSGTEGRFEVVQDGNRLTVILPDESSRSGRMTGTDSLVVGLRKGCCNGKLDGPDVIVWSDGARWQRSD